ncbi:hypothetical protein [Mycobacterium sp.]|uniref:hypothetical protein n=1 Tax=Mycobacterium sp. TaxID=1785 RepID=UPI0025E16A5C|nr:hypothetical protein [Mycobacterium sp.]
MVFAYLGGAILLAVVAWLIGPFVMRAVGIFVAVFGLAFMIVCGTKDLLVPAAGYFVVFSVGVGMWLAGHWVLAYKYHAWSSPIAQRVFSQTLLRRLDPTRGWGIRTIGPD